jgi:hypothetical protein
MEVIVAERSMLLEQDDTLEGLTTISLDTCEDSVEQDMAA